MTGPWEEIVGLVGWENISHYMKEASWGWATLGMRSPSAEELRTVAEDRHQQMLVDSETIEISGGGLKIRRFQAEGGEEWEIIFDIAGSLFSPWLSRVEGS